MLTVYLFHPSTGGKVQMKEKVHTNIRPITACFACSLTFPRGRQITKNLSKERTASDHSATIPEKKTTFRSAMSKPLWKIRFWLQTIIT